MKTLAKILVLSVLSAGVLGIGADAAEARLIANRLASNQLALATQLAPNPLAANQLSANRFEVNPVGAGDLLATEDGREVLTYAVSCALPGDITLEATVAGTTYEFPGGIGLAPEWLDHRLKKEGQRWVTACLLARVNQHATAEEISLRGAHPALTISPDEALLYSVEEGAFYGNLFTKPKKPPIEVACTGRDQALFGEVGGLVLRDCAEPDPNNPGFTKCGFTYAGHCADFTPDFPSPYACEAFGPGDPPLADHGSFYSDCHDEPGLGTWPHTKEFEEVITTFTTL